MLPTTAWEGQERGEFATLGGQLSLATRWQRRKRAGVRLAQPSPLGSAGPSNARRKVRPLPRSVRTCSRAVPSGIGEARSLKVQHDAHWGQGHASQETAIDGSDEFALESP